MHHLMLQRMRLSLVFMLLLAPLAGRCDSIEAHGAYRVAIKVTPRLGAFDADLFKESRNRACIADRATTTRMRWDEYRKVLDKVAAPLDYQLPNEELTRSAAALFKMPAWDILTTNLPGKEPDCNYGVRHVMVAVLMPGDETPQSCEFALNGEVGKAIPQRGKGFCAIHAALASNAETPVKIKVKPPGGNAVLLDGRVPEDVLIVSLGDSFASGEGNPDAPKQWKTVQDLENPGQPPQSVLVPAVWMDPWCHRSAYAGPIRAGMKMIRQPGTVTNARYRSALEAGALTMVSFACSGGKLSDSLLGSYTGVRLREAVMKERQIDAYTGKDPVLDSVVAMQPQIEQLHTFLRTQAGSPERKKGSIDLLMLSGGGNDVLFGPMMVGLMLQNLATEEKKQKLLAALEQRFQAVQRDYNRFADTFRNNVFRLNGDEYAVRSIVSVPYPDFASKPGGSCTNSDMDSIGNLPLEDAGWAAGVAQMSFSRKELEFVRGSVLRRLNGMIVDTARTYGWHTVDVSKYGGEPVAQHGWCRPGGKPYYASQQRWFRAPHDSVGLQSNLKGSFHPTWEFNEKIVGNQIAADFAAAVNAEPVPQNVRVEPVYLADGVKLTSALPAVSFAGPGADAVCQRVYLAGKGEPAAQLRTDCMTQASLQPGAHGTVVELVREARHRDYHREYARASLGKFRVDAKPPTLECRSGAGQALPCDRLAGWSRERQLTVRATDADAGVETLSLAVTGPASQRWEVPVTRDAAGALEGVIEFPEDGRYTVTACAIDRVKNQTGAGDACGVRFSHGVDATPLSPLSLQAYGSEWLDSAAPPDGIPVVPVFGAVSRGAMLRVQFGNDISGLSASADCPLISEAGCLHALDAPAAYWQKKLVSNRYADGAGNTSTVNYALVRIPRFQAGKKPRSADEWQDAAAADELVQGLRTALWIEPGLARLVATQAGGTNSDVAMLLSDTSTQAARKDAARAILGVAAQRNLLALWLNTVHGYQYAEAEVEPGATDLCEAGAGNAPAPLLAYQALRMQTRCALKNLAAVAAPEPLAGTGGQGGNR